MSLVEVKDFNALIDNKLFFYQSVKNKQKLYEKCIEVSRNDDSVTGNLSDYLYQQKYYKLIAIDLSRKIKTSIPQQINFVEKLKEDCCATKFFITEKQWKNHFKLFYRFVNFNRII